VKEDDENYFSYENEKPLLRVSDKNYQQPDNPLEVATEVAKQNKLKHGTGKPEID